MESIAKLILDWTEEKFDKIDTNSKHPYAKAFGIGVIEGIIDVSVISFPFLLGSYVYCLHKIRHENNC